MTFLKNVIPYLFIIGIVIVVRVYIFIPVTVNGSSMEVTLEDGDILLLNKIKYQFNDIKRFDIVVIDYVDGRPLIKRIVGLPGEYVEYFNDDLYVDDILIEETFIREETVNFKLTDLDYDEIPEDMYFVMGDNRDNSTDSRSIGLIEKNDILGYAGLIIYPFRRFGNAN